MKANSTMTASILGAVFAVLALGLIFQGDVKTIAGMLTGQREFSDAAGVFSFPALARALVFAFFLIGVASLFFVKVQIGQYTQRFDTAQADAVSRKKQEAANIDAARRAQAEKEKEERLHRRIDELHDKFGEFVTTQLDPHKVAYSATRLSEVGALAAQVTEIHVDGDDNFDEAVIVVHLLKETAYWRLGSPHMFEDSHGHLVDFLEHLRKASSKKLFKTYQVIAGLGLDSRTAKTDPEIPRQRAATLCAGLYNSVGANTGTVAAGLSIGTYTGPIADAGTDRERNQRSVVIVGISVKDQTINSGPVVAKVLAAVHVPGVDLGMYSDLATGNPKWVTTQDCGPVPKFLQ